MRLKRIAVWILGSRVEGPEVRKSPFRPRCGEKGSLDLEW
jgi:hypothetical protein